MNGVCRNERGGRRTPCPLLFDRACLPRALGPCESEPVRGTRYFGLLMTPWRAGSRWAVIAGAVLLSALANLMLTSPAVALNPSLDISQYAHTVWTLRDGFFPGYIEAMAQTRDGY